MEIFYSSETLVSISTIIFRIQFYSLDVIFSYCNLFDGQWIIIIIMKGRYRIIIYK